MTDLTPEKLAELRWLLDNPPQHITIARDDALALLDAAADKAAELLTTPRFPDGWERGHEAKYWAQTGLTPYGLTLDPERAPGVLNWLGVNYYTPDSPHLPASAAAPVVLPTVGEVREAIIAGTKLGGWMPHTAAQAVLDLIASRVPVWQPVEPGTVIKAGTRLREDWDDQIAEWTLGEDQDPYQNCGRRCRYYIDPATVPAEPEDQRIKRAHAIIPALQRVKNVPLGGDLLPAALEAIDAIDALEADR